MKKSNFGFYIKLNANFYLSSVVSKPIGKDFSLKEIEGFNEATQTFDFVSFTNDEFLAEYAKRGVIIEEVKTFNDFLEKVKLIAEARIFNRFSTVRKYLKAIKLAEIDAKITDFKQRFLDKNTALIKADKELESVLNTVKKLEEDNNKLLEAETFNDKKFSSNSLKIATLKRDNRELLDNRNALFAECEALDKELEKLREELKELESV